MTTGYSHVITGYSHVVRHYVTTGYSHIVRHYVTTGCSHVVRYYVITGYSHVVRHYATTGYSHVGSAALCDYRIHYMTTGYTSSHVVLGGAVWGSSHSPDNHYNVADPGTVLEKCQETTLTLSCDGGEVILIHKAEFGVLENSPCNNEKEFCKDGGEIQDYISENCALGQGCSLRLTKESFPPCKKNVKNSLKLHWSCVKRKSKNRFCWQKILLLIKK